MKIVIGTEIYLSSKFNRVWFNFAKETLAGHTVIVFDNNPQDQPESQYAQQECERNGWIYWRMMPGSLVCHSVEALGVYARNNGFDILVHLDADCPPIPGLVDRLLSELDADTGAVTDHGSAHAFAVWTKVVPTFPCERVQWTGEQRTRFTDTLSPQSGGRYYFDHCRCVWHELTQNGHRVKADSYGAIHASIASGQHPASRRFGEAAPGQVLTESHEAFFDNPKIKTMTE